MDVLELILKALQGLDANTVLIAAAAYVASPLTVHVYLQMLKRARKNAGQTVPGTVLLAVAFVGTFLLAMFLAHDVGGWTLAQASNNALASALMYAPALTVYFSVLRKREPELAADLGDTPTEIAIKTEVKP